jgi:hypothetical protein
MRVKPHRPVLGFRHWGFFSHSDLGISHYFCESLIFDSMTGESSWRAGASITGINVIPHLGHLPGLSECTSLCSGIGQV